MPRVIEDAMDEICRETKYQGSRLWVDAEQQALQPAVDDWTIQLMRKYNRNGEALLYNTIQAYLKGSRANAIRHIQLAAEEGWTVAIKLCRGAYIEHEVRALIHDTKAETDRNYDLIASYFVSQTMPPEISHLKFPPSALFLATHNAASAEKAVSTYCSRGAAGLPVTQALNCGQIQGMADELSCQLVQAHEESLTSGAGSGFQAPGVFKCLSWGSVTECLGYLHRRAVENGGAVERTQHMAAVYKKELYRRIGF
jgi:proline dehydrogenase